VCRYSLGSNYSFVLSSMQHLEYRFDIFDGPHHFSMEEPQPECGGLPRLCAVQVSRDVLRPKAGRDSRYQTPANGQAGVKLSMCSRCLFQVLSGLQMVDRPCRFNWNDCQSPAEVKIICGDTMPPFAGYTCDIPWRVRSLLRGDE
jgi:hypothetical protein